MRSLASPQAGSSRRSALLARSGRCARGPAASLAVWAALCAALFLLSSALLASQTNPAPAPATKPAHKSAHPHKKPSAAAAPAPQAAQPRPPAVPKPPDWPANNRPAAASVVYDSQGLLIVASNSSLAQILKEVSTDTGAKVEGMGTDQRIFGTYGPGPARDVLSQLLDGSGYNVLMVGDRGQGTPRQIVLTIPPGSALQSAPKNAAPQASEDDNDSDQSASESDAEQEQPQPPQNGAAPPVPVRTPQQFIQNLQERERQANQNQNGQQNPQN